MELANGDLKIAILNIFKDFKENLNLMREQMENLKREMETIKKDPNGYSRTEKYIYEMKNHWMGLIADYMLQKKSSVN